MKKIFLFFLTIVLLLGAATAEIYPAKACPHQVCVFDTLSEEAIKQVLTFTEDTTGFVSGVCEICYSEFIFYIADDEKADAFCDGTTHTYRQAAEVLEEGWYESGSVTHIYKVYRVAQCVACSEKLKSYSRSEKTNEAGLQAHTLTDLCSVGYHEAETNQHVYVATCNECGYAAAWKTPCVMFENGVCTEEISRAREFYLAD